jgi:type IV pilus assembly protein PilC
MPVYEYKGRNNRTQAVVSGELTANDAQAVTQQLRKEGVTAVSIREKKVTINVMKRSPKGVPLKDVALFSRQLAIMLDAGLPLVQGLRILADQASNKVFQSNLVDVYTDVEQGSSLSEAMRKHPRTFDNLYTNMIAAGEAGGILDTILKRLTAYAEKIIKLRRALVSASIYPSSILFVAAAVILLILYYAIPIFKSLFEGLGATLPLPTRVVIALSNFVQSYIVFIILGFVFAGFAVRSYYATEKGRKVIDRLLLNIPVLGIALRKIAVARFARTLATLFTSGVSIIEGLDITAKTAGNSVVQEAITSIRKAIEEGKTMAEPMKASGIFPAMVTQMVSIGEQTGELDTLLSKLADYYEEEVDATVENLMTLLEPIMMVFLGVTIGGIVISMYMPIFALIAKLAGG